MNILLWIIQSVITILLLYTGIIKIIYPREIIKVKLGPWIDDFTNLSLRMIGVVEILVGLGLVLPYLLHIYPFLTPLAALGLIWTMIGASMAHLKRKEYGFILINIILLIMALFIFFGRFHIIFFR